MKWVSVNPNVPPSILTFVLVDRETDQRTFHQRFDSLKLQKAWSGAWAACHIHSFTFFVFVWDFLFSFSFSFFFLRLAGQRRPTHSTPQCCSQDGGGCQGRGASGWAQGRKQKGKWLTSSTGSLLVSRPWNPRAPLSKRSSNCLETAVSVRDDRHHYPPPHA